MLPVCGQCQIILDVINDSAMIMTLISIQIAISEFLSETYKWKISLQPQHNTSPCVPPLSLWKILTNGKYPYTKPCNVPLRVSLPCLSGKSLQMENILTLNRATYLSVCPSPVSLENPYKWKISLQSTMQCISPCVPPLSVWKILTNGKYPYNHNIPLHMSLPCLSGKSLQMENILTLNRAIYLSVCPSPVSLENPYKWKISLQSTVQCTSPCVPPLSLWKILTNGKYPYNQPCNVFLRVSLPCLSGKSLQMENILTLNRAIYLSVCPSPVSLENPYKINGKYPYNQPCNVLLRVSLPCLSGKSLQMENILTINRAMYFSVCPSPVCLANPYKWKISLQPQYTSPSRVSLPCLSGKSLQMENILTTTIYLSEPCVPPLSLWKILTNGKYPYNQPCNVLLHVSLPCLSGKSLQMENILTLNRAIYLSVCPSPVSLENPYKWKISLQSTVQCTSPCVPPLSVWKILTNGKYPYTKPCNIPLRVSLPCLSGKSLQMENILTINCAMYFSVCPSPVCLENILTTTIYLSVCPSPVSLENPYKWKISLQPTAQLSYIHPSPSLSLNRSERFL